MLAAMLCSTPFGITEGGTLLILLRDPPRDRCSTPFGITEGGTLLILLRDPPRDRCSTPFGITEGGTQPVNEAEAPEMEIIPTNRPTTRTTANALRNVFFMGCQTSERGRWVRGDGLR